MLHDSLAADFIYSVILMAVLALKDGAGKVAYARGAHAAACRPCPPADSRVPMCRHAEIAFDRGGGIGNCIVALQLLGVAIASAEPIREGKWAALAAVARLARRGPGVAEAGLDIERCGSEVHLPGGEGRDAAV